MPGDVSITLMGPFALRRDGRRQPLHVAGNTKRLLMLLAASYDRGVRRDSVIDAIFPDRSVAKAGSALNTGIWRIKSLLAAHDGLEVECIDDVVRLRLTRPAIVDAGRLEAAVLAVPATPQDQPVGATERQGLSDAVETCQGEFLEGVSDHWVLPLRERYSALYIEALTILMRDAQARLEFERALTYGREILALDPFREGTQCEVMWLYASNGQRVQAIRQYRMLEALLAEELGIEPMAEARALFERICGAGAGPFPPGGLAGSGVMAGALLPRDG